MSSLTYHAEHLAWQQRVKQEKTRTSNFGKTFGAFSNYNNSSLTDKPIFPRASIEENPINYRALKHSIGYAFGGTKPIKYSLYEKNSQSKSPQKLRNKVREASSETSPFLKQLQEELFETRNFCKQGSPLERNLAYVKKLEEKLVEERKKRLKAEMKLNY